MPTPHDDHEELADSVERMLEAFGNAQAAAGSGFVAAVAVRLAATLVVASARASQRKSEQAGAIAAQAAAVGARMAPLVGDVTRAHGEAMAALEAATGEPGQVGDDRLGEKLRAAAEVPLLISEAASDVAVLAADAISELTAELRPDVVGAAQLTAGAAMAAAQLVAVNLTAREDDERVAHARACADAARAAAERALATER